tara:strand:+ start:1646 stop:2500 length:855 start_codon:yes stop_codon:yes gene_type:complete
MHAHEIFKKINFSNGLDEVIIPGDIEELPDFIFRNRNFLKVKLEYGVKIIGKYAFSNCQYLREIFIPNTVTHIKDWAFHESNSLYCISFEISSIKHIGSFVFPTNGYLKYIHVGHIKNFNQITKFRELDRYKIKCYEEKVDSLITLEHTFQEPKSRSKEAIKMHFPFPHYINDDIDLGKFSKDNFPITKIAIISEMHNYIPIILGTLDGTTYPITGWGKCRGFNVNGLFELAKEKYNELKESKWSFCLPWFNEPTKAFLLDQFLLRVVKGELDINEPILITWDE